MTWKPLRERPDERDPRPVGASLSDVARRFGLATPVVLGAIFADWERLVGASLARHARPVGLRDGVLMLDVDEPGWVTELQFLRTDLLARLADAAGPGAVTDISVRVRTATSRRRGARDPHEHAQEHPPQEHGVQERAAQHRGAEDRGAAGEPPAARRGRRPTR